MKILKIQLSILVLIFSGVLLFAPSYTYDSIGVKSYYIEDKNSGKIIMQKNQYKMYPAASTTKMVTAIIASKLIRPIDPIYISRKAERVPGSTAYLQKGESYYFRDLFKAMLLNSANDAAYALAEYVSGSEKKFVKKMNRWCKENKCWNTRFVDATGLSPRSRSSANDLCKIFRIFIKCPKIKEILQNKYGSVRSIMGRKIYLRNTNNLHKFHAYDIETVVGKTGCTDSAKYCFAGEVHSQKYNYIIIIMGAKMPWYQTCMLMNFVKYLYSHSKI